MSPEDNILDDFEGNKLSLFRRRSLLPLWIKIFIWFFMILGFFAILLFVLGLAGTRYYIEIYGLSTSIPQSGLGIFLTTIFLSKGIVALSLWLEESMAPKLALADAIVGILLCTCIMFDFPIHSREDHGIVFRPELIFLIPYLWKMAKIRRNWELASPYNRKNAGS